MWLILFLLQFSFAFASEDLELIELNGAGPGITLGFKNSITNPGLNEVETQLFLINPPKSPYQILSQKGYTLEDVPSMKDPVSKDLLAIALLRSPAQARYLIPRIMVLSMSAPYSIELTMPGPKILYQGQAEFVGIEAETPVTAIQIKTEEALVGHSFAGPYVFKTSVFNLKNRLFSVSSTTYSTPEGFAGEVNLAKEYLDLKNYKASVEHYLRGLQLTKNEPDALDDEMHADILLGLSEASIGINETKKARAFLATLLKELPRTKSSKRASELLATLSKEK